MPRLVISIIRILDGLPKKTTLENNAHMTLQLKERHITPELWPESFELLSSRLSNPDGVLANLNQNDSMKPNFSRHFQNTSVTFSHVTSCTFVPEHTP